MNPTSADVAFAGRTGVFAYYTDTIVPQPSLEPFSLDEYLGEYKGHAKISRALYVAKVCPELSERAYRIALEEIKENTTSTEQYEQVIKLMRDFSMPVDLDSRWVVAAKEKNERELLALAAEVEKESKKHLKKEAMKSQKELARMYERCGKMDVAIAKWQEARSFCVTVDENAMLFLECAHISAAMSRWPQVNNHVQRVLSTLSKLPDQMSTEIRFLQLQADFGEGNWQAVANAIETLSYETAMSAKVYDRGVLTPSDVALYGTLSGLAVLSRNNIKEKLIENPNFRLYLDHMPECLRLLQSFYSSRYSDTLARLEAIATLGRIDNVIARHISALCKLIKENIVVLYTQPFVSTSLASMAKTLHFNSASELENELVRLIESKRIQGRIDGAAGFLVNYTVNPRDRALESIERMYKSFGVQADLMLARIQYLEEEAALGGTKATSKR
ncbi:hypothetical protein GQ54DRAFT_311221 [Martensiomyces pterosporus]|nr:hypothetical protein GQ54DRAFT_311221 [Martensiomyces pterosporus]